MDEDVNLNEPICLTVFIEMGNPEELKAGIERMTQLRQFFPPECWIEIMLVPAIVERDW